MRRRSRRPRRTTPTSRPAHLVQVELQWFAAGSAQLIHQEVEALRVTQGPGVQAHPGPTAPQQLAAPRSQLTPGDSRHLVAIGVGFHVAPGLVLTNAHAVEGRQTVLVARGDRVEEARVRAFDDALDLALLEHALDGPPLPFRLAAPRVGEAVRSGGAEGRVRAEVGDRLVVHAREGLEGGGALVDASGRIVGVVVKSTSGGLDTLEALSGPAVLRWLQARGITTTVTNSAGPGLSRVATATVRVYAPPN